jgi:tRNA threonylcarbamoyladenosine dehydratase
MNMYHRTKILIKDDIEKIINLNICICGIGGVGSFVLESLARLGVQNITIIDKDVIDVTNINRQLLALNSTLGKDKVLVASKRVKDINPDCNIKYYKTKIDESNISELLNSFDYVIDCIDDVNAKISIIKHCYDNNIKIISSMGMANRLDPLKIKVSDINKTTMCPLARKIRVKLKEINVKKLKVVYSIESPIKTDKSINGNVLGSVSFVPSVAGLIIASEILKDIKS